MKIYKLSKTFENSMYPIEKDLYELKNNLQKTKTGLSCNIAAAFFSGAGTSILFNTETIQPLIQALSSKAIEKDPESWAPIYWSLGITLFIFLFLFLLGCLISFTALQKTEQKKVQEQQKKKKTDEGRRELEECFHKSIINNITTGISFVNKAEENHFSSEIDKMYLHEAAYYFKLAKREYDIINFVDSSETKVSQQLITLIGRGTLLTTLSIFLTSVTKMLNNAPNIDENGEIDNIRKHLDSHINYLQKDKPTSVK